MASRYKLDGAYQPLHAPTAQTTTASNPPNPLTWEASRGTKENSGVISLSGDTDEMLCAFLDAIPVNNRSARSLCHIVFSLSGGSDAPFAKTFELVGSRLIGDKKSPRAKLNAVSYARRQIGVQPLISCVTENVAANRKRSVFSCNWPLIEKAFEIRKRLDFQPHQRQESCAEAARLALESIGFFPNSAPIFSKSFPSAEQTEARIRKSKATIKTLTRNIVRDVHTLGLSPAADIQQIITYCQESLNGDPAPLPLRGSLRYNIKLRDKLDLNEAEEFYCFPPSPDELEEIGLISTPSVDSEINLSEVSASDVGTDERGTVKLRRMRSTVPADHALAEVAVYREWGLSYLKKTELNANDECQEHVHKFPLAKKRLVRDVIERANANQWSLIVRPPHIVRAKHSGIAVIHLDDLPLDVGMEIVGYFGGVLKETSKDNHQVLFPVLGVTYSRLFDQLRRGFIAGTDADRGANGATRLCGSLNIKPVHEDRRGCFPMVRAVAIGQGRIRTVTEALASGLYTKPARQVTARPIADQSVAAWRGDVPNIAEIERRVIAAGEFSGRRGYEGRASQSHVHYRFLCALALRMIRQERLNREQLKTLLFRESASARERWERTPIYINRTMEKAIGRAQMKAKAHASCRKGAAA
jgi:hypothetical protein